MPQSAAEEQLYADQIAEYFADTNFTPEFPRTAELIREMWKRPQQRLDGVLSVDAVSLSYLLRATGPVSAPGGVRLTPENARVELLTRSTSDFPTTQAQNDFFTAVARLISTRSLPECRSPTELLRAFGQSATRGSASTLHDFDPRFKSHLREAPCGGTLPAATPGPPCWRIPERRDRLQDVLLPAYEGQT